MGLLVLFNKEQTIKTFKTACLLAFYHKKNSKRIKKNERGIVIRNKARLVAQGYTQEEGIDYDKGFALFARIEALRLFLAYASFKDFVVYEMDIKSAFIYGNIKKEVYVYQPLGFEDPYFSDREYKVEKTLYGLHQAPRAWYETLSTYMLDNRFQRGKIDKTLFIKRHKGDILLVQVYVDDIIFGSTKKELCIAFERLMHENIQMSSIGELTFFLGLQVKQKKDGTFISKDKYVDEILKKFGFTKVKTASTPIETQKPLLKDEDGDEVDVHMYRPMNGSFMYLTSSRSDIMFAVCAYTRYQVYPNISHLHAVKRTFSDCAEASLDRKSTKGVVNFLDFWSTAMAITINEEVQIHAQVDGKEIVITESSVRRDLQLADEKDKAVDKELGDNLVRAAITTSSLEAEQDSETIDDTIAQTRFESVSKQSNDSLLSSGNTFQSDEDRLKLDELMALCTNLQNKVLDLEKTKTTQFNEIASFKRRVKKVEKRNRSRTHRLKRLYKVGLSARVESSRDEESLGEDASKQGRIDAIDANEDITLVSVHDDADKEMFDVNILGGEEFVARQNENVVEEVVDAAQVQKATLFQQLLEKRRKHFAAERAEEKRNKPPTKDQQRKIMSTYLKNMEGYKLKDLKLKEFDRIQEMFDREFRRVNTFEDIRPELVEGKEKRATEELEQHITKKKKVDDDKEKAELKLLI
nr:putative ribonuclease H-like domain-containing protein [Tanacetum cinerariifolium]